MAPMYRLRRWHCPHPVAGFQLAGITGAVICGLGGIALVALMVSGSLQPSVFLIVVCAFLAFGTGVGWSWYTRGVWVSAHGLRMRSPGGSQTLRWDEIKAIREGRSRVPDETDQAIWIVLEAGGRVEAPLKGSQRLPSLGMMTTQVGTKVTARTSLVLPMNEFHDALRVLRECLAKSRSGPLRFE